MESEAHKVNVQYINCYIDLRISVELED